MDWILDLRGSALVATLFYAGGFFYAFAILARQRRYARSVLLLLVLVGFAVQTWGLYLRGMETRACPVGNPFEVLQFITWSLILLYLLTGPAFRISLLGFFSAGLAILLSVVSLAVPAWDEGVRREVLGGNPWIEAHAALAIFSYGAFALLAVASLMYLIQHQSLLRKRGQPIFGFLPSIRQLEQMKFRLLLSAVLIYTVAVAIGWVYWRSHWDEVSLLKVGFSLSLWAGYFAVFLLHITHRLHTRKFAWVCIGLFVLALVTLLPVELSREYRAPTPATPLSE